MIVATPFASAVAMPVTGSIVATPAGDADHAKVRPRITLPPASRATALKDCVRPRALSVAVAGETTTDVSTCCTESVAVPDAPAVVAVIVTEPGARPVASPVPSTVAITGSDELHANVWPATVRPLPSSATALNCCGRPTAASAALAGLNTTDRTTCATEQVALPEIPFVVAVIVAPPFASAVTMPLTSTGATRGLSDVHVNAGPGMTLPLASSALALKRWVRPSASSVAVTGATTTCATAPGSTASVGSGDDVTGLPLIVAPIVSALPASRPVNGAVYVPSPWSVVAPIAPVLVPPVAVNATVRPPVVRLFPKASLARSVSVVMAPERILVTDAVTSDAAVETAPARAVAPNVTAGSAPARASKLCGPAMLPSVTRVCA